MWSPSVPKSVKALVGTQLDEEKLLDELARNGIRHYRLHKEYMEGMTRHVSTTNGYLTERVKKKMELRRSFQKALSPDMNPEQTKAALDKMIGDLDKRMQRWQQGKLSLSDRFYMKVTKINLPHCEKSKRDPREIICVQLDRNDVIKSVAMEPFARKIPGSSFRR